MEKEEDSSIANFNQEMGRPFYKKILIPIIVVVFVLLIISVLVILKTTNPEKKSEGIQSEGELILERDCSDLFIIPEEYKNYFENSGVRCIGENVYFPPDEESLSLDDAGNLNIINENRVTVIPRKPEK